MNEKTLTHEEVVKLLTPRALEFYENHKGVDAIDPKIIA